MGYMKHNAIVVTCWSCREGGRARDVAVKLFSNISEVTNLTAESTNGYVSFMIAPDGSKEGWCTSDHGDKARDHFCKFMDDHSIGNYVEVQFADESRPSIVVRSR